MLVIEKKTQIFLIIKEYNGMGYNVDVMLTPQGSQNKRKTVRPGDTIRTFIVSALHKDTPVVLLAMTSACDIMKHK